MDFLQLELELLLLKIYNKAVNLKFLKLKDFKIELINIYK